MASTFVGGLNGSAQDPEDIDNRCENQIDVIDCWQHLLNTEVEDDEGNKSIGEGPVTVALRAKYNDCKALLASDDTDTAEYIDMNCEGTINDYLGSQTASERWFTDGTNTSTARTSFGINISSYNIYSDHGGNLGWGQAAAAQLQSYTWTAGIIALRLAAWAVAWVVDGQITHILSQIWTPVADVMQQDVIPGVRLREMALLALGISVGWSIVRGKHAQAFGNIAFALVGLTVGGLILADMEGYFEGAQKVKNGFVTLALQGGDNRCVKPDTSGPDDLDSRGYGCLTSGGEITSASITSPLLGRIVHDPWERLNFGRRLGTTDGELLATANTNSPGMSNNPACEIYTGAITLNLAIPSDHENWPRKEGLAKCGGVGAEVIDVFNREPSGSRLLAGVSVLIGHIAIAMLLFATAGLALVSELLLALSFGIFPVVAVMIAWPGAGRRLAQTWFTMFIKGVTGLAAGVLFLRLVVTVLEALAQTPNIGDFDRFAVYLLVAIGAVKLRKVFPAAAANLADSISGKVAAAGSGGGVGAAAAGGALVGAGAGLLGGGAISQHLQASKLNPVNIGARAVRGTKTALHNAITKGGGQAAGNLATDSVKAVGRGVKKVGQKAVDAKRGVQRKVGELNDRREAAGKAPGKIRGRTTAFVAKSKAAGGHGHYKSSRLGRRTAAMRQEAGRRISGYGENKFGPKLGVMESAAEGPSLDERAQAWKEGRPGTAPPGAGSAGQAATGATPAAEPKKQEYRGRQPAEKKEKLPKYKHRKRENLSDLPPPGRVRKPKKDGR